jgi:large subunit ribosomal protein L23
MHSIIKRPIVTEKNTLRAGLLNEHGFEVSLTANRQQIKQAIEKLFSVKVERVNTMVCREESRKLGKFPGKRKFIKKAIVKLKDGEKFEFAAG